MSESETHENAGSDAGASPDQSMLDAALDPEGPVGDALDASGDSVADDDGADAGRPNGSDSSKGEGDGDADVPWLG